MGGAECDVADDGRTSVEIRDAARMVGISGGGEVVWECRRQDAGATDEVSVALSARETEADGGVAASWPR
jgi:hypothetical protein